MNFLPFPSHYYQQAKAVEMHTDLKVGMYWGAMGVDFWDAATWKQEIEKNEVGIFHIYFN